MDGALALLVERPMNGSLSYSALVTFITLESNGAGGAILLH